MELLKTKKRQALIISLLFIGVVLLFVVSISSSGNSKQDMGSQTKNTLQLGDEGVVKYPDDNTAVVGASSKDAYNQFLKTVSAKDEVGYNQLIAQGLIFHINSGTKAKLIDMSFGIDEVRLEEGTYKDQTAWLAMENFIKTNQP